jgi:hopanoid biosynthesis associated RND transporter like protein HpnN
MHDAFEARLGGWLAVCTDACRRRPLLVIALSLLAAAGSLLATALHLHVRGDTEYLLSQELPFKQSERRYQEAFPLLYENLFVVIDAVTPERAGEAASALAERMQDRPHFFRGAFLPGGGDFFEQHAFLYLEREELEDLADRLAQVQPYLAELSRDGSLRGLASMLGRGTRAVRDGEVAPANLEPIFEGLGEAVEAQLAGRSYHLSWAEMLQEGSIEGNPRRRFLLVQPVLDVTDIQPAKGAIQEIRRLARNLGLTAGNGVSVRITGDVALSDEEIGLVKSQAAAAALGSLMLVSLVLAVGLRSLRMIAAVIATLLVGLALNLGFTTVAVGHLNMISAAFAVLFIGLGVELEIHFAMRYQELLARGRGHATALYETAGDVGSSLFLTAAATAIGFFSFIPTHFVGVAELGLISGAGILIGFLCTMTLLPALLSLGPPPAPDPAPRTFAWTTRQLAELPVRYPRAVRWTALALALGTVFVLPRVRFDNNPLNVRDPSAESVQTFMDLLEGTTTTSPWTVNAVAPDVASADALAERLRGLDVVGRVVTLADFIPSEQQEKLGIIEDVATFLAPLPGPDGRVPPPTPQGQIEALATLEVEIGRLLEEGVAPELAPAAAHLRDGLRRYRELVATLPDPEPSLAALQGSVLGALPEQLRILSRALEAGEVTLENLPDALVERMLAADGRVRLEIFPRQDLADHAALAAFVDGVRTVVPDVAGSASEILESGRAVERALTQALLTALGAMTLVLLLVWRRVLDTALVVAPLLLAAAFTVGAAVLLRIPFNFADVIVLPLLIGIGVDAAIHMVHRARATGGAGNLLTTSTARAIAYGSATNVASFGTMGLASHLGLATMGQLLTVGVILTLVCNLVVLPALLDLRHRSGEAVPRRRGRPPAAEASAGGSAGPGA